MNTPDDVAPPACPACRDWEAAFDLFHTASMALMYAYKAAHPDGHPAVWPDATAVTVWAAAELARLRANEKYLTWLDAEQMKTEVSEKDTELAQLRARLEPVQGLLAAKYLNGACAAHGCQWLTAHTELEFLRADTARLRAALAAAQTP